jgi:hypothetical protein
VPHIGAGPGRSSSLPGLYDAGGVGDSGGSSSSGRRRRRRRLSIVFSLGGTNTDSDDVYRVGYNPGVRMFAVVDFSISYIICWNVSNRSLYKVSHPYS